MGHMNLLAMEITTIILIIVIAAIIVVWGAITVMMIRALKQGQRKIQEQQRQLAEQKKKNEEKKPAETAVAQKALDPDEDPEDEELDAVGKKPKVYIHGNRAVVNVPVNIRNQYEVAELQEEYDESDHENGLMMVGNRPVRVIYRKSFEARLIQSSQQTKEWYTEIVNHILSYQMKGRVSWNFASFRYGRERICRINIHNDELSIYYPLDITDKLRKTYNIEKARSRRYERTPARLKITDNKEKQKALELIDSIAAKFNLKRGKNVSFERISKYPYDTKENLIVRGLIKYALVEGDYFTVGLFSEREKLRASVSQLVREEISADEAHSLITDEAARDLLITEYSDDTLHKINLEAQQSTKKKKKKHRVERAVVDLDVLSQNFVSGAVIALKDLKERRLVSNKAKELRVIASGKINKPLIVYAEEFTPDAVKMLVLTGGKAIQK